ncbi:MAG: ATP-dependent helicase [Bacteroidales bacterium]|nr:ATP-dependent helicase [Bacteroidales bacterium]
MDSSLKVYKASAGSGKTFTLAVEYIKLLVDHPSAYKHILAVTFTNKATAEMKERILSQLYGISHSLPSSESYFKIVRASFPKLSDAEVRERTDRALRMMLHDYSHFRVQTIDAFFQTILRGLARELDLSGDVAITLDSEKLLEEAVDTLIKKLTPTAKEMLWLVEYIEEHLSNDKSWHINETIKEFAKNILSEVYQEKGEKLRTEIDANNGALLAEYRKTINSIEKEILNVAHECANRFFAIAEEAGLTVDDFYQKKSGLWGFFTKLKNDEFPIANKFVTTCVEAPEKMSKSPALSPSTRQEIITLIEQAIILREKNLPILNSCRLSTQRFHQLRLLNSIAQVLNEENNRENRFLLAQTTYLLSQMITGNTSFIFEKIGAEIHHIFIDEFQDTSSLQWKNFKVMLHEAISRGNKCLIVGDVKQSIYRWRNSDWSILNNLEKEFPNHLVKSDTLKINRRSERNIIDFNNKLFTSAARQISEQYTYELGESGEELTRAYSDVEQEILPEKPQKGYVEVRMIDKENGTLEESVYKQLMNTLGTLLDEKGVKPSDITILVRRNKEIAPIAKLFGERFPSYSITSDDAYLLSSSTALNILIAALRYISTPDDKINIAYLVSRYSHAVKNTQIDITAATTNTDIEKILPENFNQQIETLRRKPVYEILEQLTQILQLHTIKGEQAYIFSFLDHAARFLKENPAAIEDFINNWEDEISKKSIPAGESDGVRILSIHKSKGLEFHTVIIPFCTWELTGGGHRNIIWCKPNVPPFNEISLLPIDYQSSMLESIYKNEYSHEYLYQLVDNLNLLYVACTRAGKNLIIFSDKSGGRGDTISKRLLTLLESITSEDTIYDKEKQIFTYGEIVPSQAKEKHENDNPFTNNPTNIVQKFASYDNKLSFKQSRNLTRFLANKKEEQQTLDYIARGELLHELLSKIHTGTELSRQIRKMRLQGIIATDAESNNIEKLIKTALSNPKAQEWFEGKYKLYNECTILHADEDRDYRPDRVMVDGEKAIVVDFKFGTPKPEYPAQVHKYMSLLMRMGYTNVKGYLWYIYNNKIEEVK